MTNSLGEVILGLRTGRAVVKNLLDLIVNYKQTEGVGRVKKRGTAL